MLVLRKKEKEPLWQNSNMQQGPLGLLLYVNTLTATVFTFKN